MANLHKVTIRNKVIDAIHQCGWSVLILSELDKNPFFKLRVYNNESRYNLKIYSWNLSYGGKSRSKDEYRIQVKINRDDPNLNRFIVEVGYKILIIGYSDEYNVFAAFNFNKHLSTLAYSASFQIKLDTLINASRNGIDTHNKDNNELAIAFRPDFIIDYIENLQELHAFGESITESNQLRKLIAEPTEINNEILGRFSGKRGSIVKTITRRARNASFNGRVLKAYNYSCAFCGIQLKLVDAAHILPVAHEDSTDETANGVALCPLHHRAFDGALVAFDSNYKTHINRRRLEDLIKLELDGGIDLFKRSLQSHINIPDAPIERPNKQYINKANKFKGWNLI
ncbi:MAG: HNH endonuclease [Armatimonadetes bacterium]|nr:HNH endonuclease [Armatimonadota bacterium]